MKWTRKIQAFLHDPPDKAIKIANHEERAKEILRSAGIEYRRGREDILASAVQRVTLDLNKVIDFYGKGWGNYVWSGYPQLRLPISAEKVEYPNLTKFIDRLRRSKGYKAVDELLSKIVEVEKRVFKELVKDGYSKLWNSYPMRLKEELAKTLESEGVENAGEIAEEFVNLPAETRYPDHTIWAHLDLASALTVDKPILVRIKISPVQDFIKNARKEADLWAGSHMLSYLTFQALKPIIEEFGPDAVIYPHLRGQPFFVKEILKENSEGLEVANIPNKALAIVSEEKFEELKRKIEDSFKQTLIKMYEFAVKRARDKYGISFDPQEYIHILEDYFKITVEKISFRNFSSYDEIIDFLSKHGILDEDRRKWFEFLKEFSKYPPQPTELYPVLFEILESATNIESSKFEKREQVSGWKCKLCGENLAILGDKFEYGELMKIWKREPLCPICLVKRFYRKYLEKEYKEYDIKRFETVTDVCLRAFNWINEFKKRKEHGKFIEILKKYNLTKDEEPCDPDMYYLEFWNTNPEKIKERIEEWCGKEVPLESVEKASTEVLGVLRKAYGEINKNMEEIYGKVDLPPKYYAILKLDGDEMGKILSGRKSSKVSDYAHEALKEFFDEKQKEDVKRALSPSHHIAISQALSRFAVEFVRKTVEEHGGDLIYAGGDDVLAILPIDKAFACAKKLADYFSSAEMFVPWKNGGKSGLTMSGGLLIVHYKHPLYDAIDRVNKLEKRAKSLGRNALAVGYLKRSGSYDEVVVSWDVLSEVERLVELLKNSEKNVKPSLSRRIIYHLVRDVENLPDDENAVRSFIRYEISRHYSEKDVDQLVDNVMKASEKVRVELVKEDIGLEDEKIASRINRAIAECKRLSEIGIPNEILGIVTKKQVKGLFLLLKILSDCKAELWGGKNEGDNRA